eukprot:4030794-Ditylum_brightwellii.AAC.1
MYISGKHLTLEEVCNIVEHNYHTIKLGGKWDGVSSKSLLSEDKGPGLEAEKSDKYKHQICTGLHFQPLLAGRSDWRVFHCKVMFWRNICSNWNPTQFAKKKEGVNTEGYLDNTMINGHQHGVGKHSKKIEEDKTNGSEQDAKSSASIASVPRPDVSWAATLLDQE